MCLPRLGTIRSETAWLASAASKANETRKAKPEVVVGGATAAAAIVSVLLSRRRLLTNVVTVGCGTAAAVYGSLWYENRGGLTTVFATTPTPTPTSPPADDAASASSSD